MLQDKKIGFIGSGNMGEALVSGLVLSKAAKPENILCSDIDVEILEDIRKKYGVRTTTSNIEVCEQSDIIVYATKPQILGAVLKQTAPALDQSKLIISIAAGVPLAAIAVGLDKELRLIRSMPNICAFVKESATAIAAGEFVIEGDVEMARAIFDSVGKTVFIQENVLMDAFTGLSGSGPAYIFTIVDAMADAGVKMGLSRKTLYFFPPRRYWVQPACFWSPRNIRASSRTGWLPQEARPLPGSTPLNKEACAPP